MKTAHLVEYPNVEMIIKSARVFQKNSLLYIDYRVNTPYRTDGKDRTRFSTGEKATRRAFQRIDREKYTLSLTHYLEATTLLDGANLLLETIALEALEEGRHNRQSDVQNDYLTIYEKFIQPHFGKSVLRDIKVSHIKAWKTDLLTKQNLSKARFIKYFRTLNFIFKYALENEIIDKNPVSLVDKKSKLFSKSKKNLDNLYYTAKEAEAMLANSTGWFHVMLMVYLHTGMRSGEGLALKFSDIDFENNTITIQRSIRKCKLKDSTKTGEDRVVLLSQPLQKSLLAYKEVSSSIWLFPNPKTDNPYCEPQSIVKKHFKPLLKKCGIEYLSFYCLRHTFASLSAQKNIPMSIISKQLGHSKISTTLDFYVKHNLISKDNDIHIFDSLYT